MTNDDSNDKANDKEKESIVQQAQFLLDELNKNEYIGGYENDDRLLDFCWIIDDMSIYHKTCFQEMQKYGDVEMVADGLWKGQIPAKQIEDIFMLTSTTSALDRYAAQKYKSDGLSEKEELEFTINTPLFLHLEKHSVAAKLGLLLKYGASMGFEYYLHKTLHDAHYVYGQIVYDEAQKMKYKYYKCFAERDIQIEYMVPKRKMEVYRIVLKYYPDAIFQYVPEWNKDITGDKTWHWFDIYIPTENLAIGLTSQKSYENALKSRGEQTLKRRKFYEKQRKDLCGKHGVKWCELNFEEKITDDNFQSLLE